jgi:hypothetical protein
MRLPKSQDAISKCTMSCQRPSARHWTTGGEVTEPLLFHLAPESYSLPLHFVVCPVSSPLPSPLLWCSFKADAEGTLLTVAQYFWETYNYALQFPSLPALEVGNPERNNYLPMEVCRIVEGQRYVRKLNERQITRMLQITCQRPHVRAQQTEAVRPTHFFSGPGLQRLC